MAALIARDARETVHARESMSDHSPKAECYIVVDVEASGPNPGQYALLSVGACTLDQPRHTFYVELQPDKAAFTAEAMAVNGLSLEALAARGLPPGEALGRFAGWLAQNLPPGARPVFTAFNAAFDWMFVNDYFWRYLGYNPFGHAALDIKAYYVGQHGAFWGQSSHRLISRRYGEEAALTHHALDDALDEARLFETMLAERRSNRNQEERI
jgi:DNA polymerase III epsilon subunit-like protein